MITAKDIIANIEHFPSVSKDINKFINTLDLGFVAPEMRREYVILKMEQSGKFDTITDNMNLRDVNNEHDDDALIMNVEKNRQEKNKYPIHAHYDTNDKK